MNNNAYLRVVSLVFFVIAVLHVLRLLGGWEAVFNGYVLPMWISFVAVLVALFLAVRGYQLSKRS